MLYGIQRGQQMRLAREGKRLRVLISYGEYWFPWYMRRLAERPANVWFVVRTCWVQRDPELGDTSQSVGERRISS